MNSPLMAFPLPTGRMQLAFAELAVLGRGREGAALILATGEDLPRPWDLTTIADPTLLAETWAWLSAFVTWLNTQHAWFSSDLTPPCWKQHPSLIHQLATLAVSRYFAGEGIDVAAMEEWHRFALPTYLERTRDQRHSCEEKHVPWPARAACSRAQAR